jgi:hypothetical protein
MGKEELERSDLYTWEKEIEKKKREIRSYTHGN